jgi:membrane-associated phospholipid phosphatase
LQDNIPRRVDEPFSMLSIIGSFEVTTTLLGLFLVVNAIRTKKYYRVLLMSFFVLFHIVEVLGKSAIEHHGPPFMFLRYTYDLHFPSGYVSSDYFSYPSGHVGRTLFIAGVFGILVYSQKWSFRKKIVTVGMLAAISLVMIISRVYLGEHWFTDTVGGTLLGLSFAFFTMVFW